MVWEGYQVLTHEALEQGAAFLVGGNLLTPNREVIGKVTEVIVGSDGVRSRIELNEKGSAWWRTLDSAPHVSHVVTPPERPQEAPGGHGSHDAYQPAKRGGTPRGDR